MSKATVVMSGVVQATRDKMTRIAVKIQRSVAVVRAGRLGRGLGNVGAGERRKNSRR